MYSILEALIRFRIFSWWKILFLPKKESFLLLCCVCVFLSVWCRSYFFSVEYVRKCASFCLSLSLFGLTTSGVGYHHVHFYKVSSWLCRRWHSSSSFDSFLNLKLGSMFLGPKVVVSAVWQNHVGCCHLLYGTFDLFSPLPTPSISFTLPSSSSMFNVSYGILMMLFISVRWLMFMRCMRGTWTAPLFGGFSLSFGWEWPFVIKTMLLFRFQKTRSLLFIIINIILLIFRLTFIGHFSFLIVSIWPYFF